jgi:predicted small metal-binding protein
MHLESRTIRSRSNHATPLRTDPPTDPVFTVPLPARGRVCPKGANPMTEKQATVIRCRDVGLDCDGVIRAETEGEALRRAVQHLEREHRDIEITPEVLDSIREAVQMAQE